MPQPPQINLLKAKTSRSPELTAIIGQLRTLSIVLLMAVLALGIILGSGFFFYERQLSFLTNQKSQLVSSITQNARKETLLLVLKARLDMVGKVMTSQRQWSPAVDMALRITTPPTLSVISVDDKGVLTMRMKASSISEVSAIIGRVTAELQANHLKNPILQEFGLTSDGTVKLTISFNALL